MDSRHWKPCPAGWRLSYAPHHRLLLDQGEWHPRASNLIVKAARKLNRQTLAVGNRVGADQNQASIDAVSAFLQMILSKAHDWSGVPPDSLLS
jgi:hypothetical protein